MEENEVEERDDFLEILESRFLFLAANANYTLRGWRPSCPDDLPSVNRKRGVPCLNKLSAEDLKVQIFLHFLNECSSHEGRGVLSIHGRLEVGLRKWKVDFLSAVKDEA